MVLSKTYPQTRRDQGGVAEGLYNRIKEVDDKVDDIEVGTVPAGSISTDEIANLAVTEGKIATSAVTSGKIADGSVGAAKLRGDIKPFTSAGVTIAALTAAIGDPATLPDGYIAAVKDSSDSNKIKIVTVFGGAFGVSLAQTAAV